jgi:hypothetical protein
MTIKSIERSGHNITITLINGVVRSYRSSSPDRLIAAFRHADEVGRLDEPDEIWVMASGPGAVPTEEERFFDIEYLLDGESEYQWGMTLATDETDALRNFCVDYSPSMGQIVAIRMASQNI